MSPPVITPLAIIIQQIITNANDFVNNNEETKTSKINIKQLALINGPQVPQR
jgi:hypothetical protein